MESKDFDAVDMMRNIREKLSEKYWNNPSLLKKQMDEIRKKYNLEVKTSTELTIQN